MTVFLAISTTILLALVILLGYLLAKGASYSFKLYQALDDATAALEGVTANWVADEPLYSLIYRSIDQALELLDRDDDGEAQ